MPEILPQKSRKALREALVMTTFSLLAIAVGWGVHAGIQRGVDWLDAHPGPCYFGEEICQADYDRHESLIYVFPLLGGLVAGFAVFGLGMKLAIGPVGIKEVGRNG